MKLPAHLVSHREQFFSRLMGDYRDMSLDDVDYLREVIRQHPLTQMAVQAGYPESTVVRAMEYLIRDNGARLNMVDDGDRVLVSIIPTRLH